MAFQGFTCDIMQLLRAVNHVSGPFSVIPLTGAEHDQEDIKLGSGSRLDKDRLYLLDLCTKPSQCREGSVHHM
jgi:hypothetical protein